MNKPSVKEINQIRQNIFCRLNIVIATSIFSCLLIGASLGFLLAGQSATAELKPDFAVAPEALSASFAEVARQVEPAVVNIDTKQNAKAEDKSDPLEAFRRGQPRRAAYSVGSGFIVDKQGFILTNKHVVEDSDKIKIRLDNGEEYLGEIIGSDEETDLAVVKINAGKDLPTVKLGDSSAAQVGDWVLAMGSPFGLDKTVTAGIISQIGRQTPSTTNFQRFIQTDAAINKGNSGGPLINMRGEVVGINSQIATTTGDYNGIGFALPSNEAAQVYSQIIKNGRVRRGYLGVTLETAKAEYAKIYGLPEAKGAIVIDTPQKDSPAEKVGFKIGDVITEINGQKAENREDLVQKIAAVAPDENAEIVYYRETGNKFERKTVTVQLAERPFNTPTIIEKSGAPTKIENAPKIGLLLTEITPQMTLARVLKETKGLLIKDIDPNGIISDIRSDREDLIAEGDILVKINRIELKTLADFERVEKDLKIGDAVVLNVARYDSRNKRIVPRIVQFTFK